MRFTPRAAIALVVYVALSSYFGLNGRTMLWGFAGTFEFMAGIWSVSIVADIVFTAGTLAVGYGTFLLARSSVVAALVAGAVATWIIYAASWAALTAFDTETYEGMPSVLPFVAQVGFVGIIVAAVLPVLAWRYRWVETAPEAEVGLPA